MLADLYPILLLASILVLVAFQRGLLLLVYYVLAISAWLLAGHIGQNSASSAILVVLFGRA